MVPAQSEPQAHRNRTSTCLDLQLRGYDHPGFPQPQRPSASAATIAEGTIKAAVEAPRSWRLHALARLMERMLPAHSGRQAHQNQTSTCLDSGRRGYDHAGGTRSPNVHPMQRLSIARSLRLALVALTLALAAIAALGVASLYNSRQSYENKLEQTSSLATAAANLAGAGIAEEEVLRDARGPQAAAAARPGRHRLPGRGQHGDGHSRQTTRPANTWSKPRSPPRTRRALSRRITSSRPRPRPTARSRPHAPSPPSCKPAKRPARRRPASRPATPRAGRCS